MSKTNGEQPNELKRMRQRLDEFRRSTRPGVSFPGWVWAAAARLARRHGVNRTGRALGLEYNKLKRACGGSVATAVGRGRQRRAAGAVKFVELTPPMAFAGTACRVHLTGPAGQRVELQMPAVAATELVLGLCRAGFGARS